MKTKVGKFQWLIITAALTGATVILALVFTTKPVSDANDYVEKKEVQAQIMGNAVQSIEKTEHKKKPIEQANGFTEIAQKDLNEVKKLRSETKINQLFDAETQVLAQDVMHAANRVSYFPARRALIEELKSEKNAAKLKKIILDYDTSTTLDGAELPTIVHFSFIALGELSRKQGVSQAVDIYKGIADRLSGLENQKSSEKIQAARLTDVYDLTRNIMKNQLSSSKADWPEIAEVLEGLKIRDNFLNHHMKNQIKNAVASAIDLDSVSNLESLHQKLDEWWD